MRLTQCVTVVIFGFFSPDDKMKDAQFCFESNHSEARYNFLAGTEIDLLHHITVHFSPHRSTILDLSAFQGIKHVKCYCVTVHPHLYRWR